jgi:peptide methionine sulfoxide reductase MsrA
MKGFFVAEPEHQDYYGGKPRATARRSKTALKKATKSQTKTKRASTNLKPTSPATTEPAARPSN